MDNQNNSEDKLRKIFQTAKEKSKATPEIESSDTVKGQGVALLVKGIIDFIFAMGRISVVYLGYSAATEYVAIPKITYPHFVWIAFGAATIFSFFKKLFKE